MSSTPRLCKSIDDDTELRILGGTLSISFSDTSELLTSSSLYEWIGVNP